MDYFYFWSKTFNDILVPVIYSEKGVGENVFNISACCNKSNKLENIKHIWKKERQHYKS